jgi:hypothetical protein
LRIPKRISPCGLSSDSTKRPFREAPRLLELVGRHRLGGDLLELGRDRRHRVVDAVDVDAGLRVERARIGVAVVGAEDVVGEAATFAYLGEEARRHSAAEHGRDHLQRVPVGVLDRVARHAEDEVRLVGRFGEHAYPLVW